MVIEPPPPTPTDRFSGFIINITRPDNATELIGPYLSDSNGSAHDIYLPAKYGIYKLQLNYSGESFAGGIVYKGTASAIITLNVTQEPQPVPTPSPTPEPTPAPTPTPEPTPPPSPSPAPQSTATPSPQPQQSPTATPSPEPTPELPEFPSWIILPAFITATLVAGIVYRRKRSRQLLFNFPNNIQNFG
jgi:cell division septation protein DedD